MENKDTKKPQVGAWDKMISATDRKEKLKFDFDKPVVVTLNCSQPREIEWEDSVFYIFDVFYNGEDRVISTSAWSLLRALRELGDLKGKTVRITKKMIAGKQQYLVEEIKEEAVKASPLPLSEQVKIPAEEFVG